MTTRRHRAAGPSGPLRLDVVLVANAGQYADTLDLEDPHLRRGQRGLRVWGRTQAANDLLAVELAERLTGDAGRGHLRLSRGDALTVHGVLRQAQWSLVDAGRRGIFTPLGGPKPQIGRQRRWHKAC